MRLRTDLCSENAVTQQLRQGGGQRAPQADRDQHDDVADDIRCSALEDLDNGHTVDLVAGVQAHANGRRDQTDGKAGDHHSAELQRREAVLLHDRQQNGGQQQDGGADVDEGTDQQDQHVKDQCNGPCGQVEGHEECAHGLRHLLHGEHPCEDGGKADDEHDGGGGDQGLFQCLPDTLPGQLLVNEEAHQNGVQHSDTGALGGGADAKGNADDDEHRQGQAGLSTVGAAHLLAVDWLGWLCYF